MKNILMASAAVLALASTVSAEGNFQGFYAGINGGYATAKTDVRNTIPAFPVAANITVAGAAGFCNGVKWFHRWYSSWLQSPVWGFHSWS